MVAMGVFIVVAVVAGGLLVNIVNLERRNSVEAAMYNDARVIIRQLSQEIANGTIDYDEYYSIKVLGAEHYGLYHGAYGSRFFDPGLQKGGDAGINPADLGTVCSYPDNASADDCEVYYKPSVDLNVGQNPWKGKVKDANAFCDKNSAKCDQTEIVADELYLLDKTGMRKTILGRKKINEKDYAIGMVRMQGTDEDQNGFVDTFSCEKEYTCDNGASILDDKFSKAGIESGAGGFSLPLRSDLTTDLFPNLATSHFLPITPLKINIKALHFIITPVEDPYKAFAEIEVQYQPTVTIVLTMGLSEEEAQAYPGTFEDITVQTTVATGVRDRLDSYPPTDNVKWIDDVMKGKSLSVQ